MSASMLLVALGTAGCVALLGNAAVLRRAPSRRSPDVRSTQSTHRTPNRGHRWRKPPPGRVYPAAAQWCDAAGRAIRSGATLSTALAEATETADQPQHAVVSLVASLRRGQPVASAATAQGTRLASESPDDPFVLVLAVVAASAELGGPAAAPLERTAATLRMRAALAEEQHAQSAQARLSAQVLTVVPLGLLALLTLTASDVRAVLPTPAGLALVTAGGALNGIGWWWMRRIVNGTDRR